MIRILAVGKLKDARLGDLVDEYVKRCRAWVDLEIRELRDQDPVREAQAMLARLGGAGGHEFVVALDEKGEAIDSRGLARLLAAHGSVTFLIGGPDGLGDALREPRGSHAGAVAAHLHPRDGPLPAARTDLSGAGHQPGTPLPSRLKANGGGNRRAPALFRNDAGFSAFRRPLLSLYWDADPPAVAAPRGGMPAKRDWNMNPTLRSTTVIAVLLLFLGGPAAAATLLLTGTPGAAVTLDGVRLGVLPLDGPVTLDEGGHLLKAERRGMMPFTTMIDVPEADAVVRENVRMTPLSRRDAVGYSLVCAGLGQRYEGRRMLGWILTAVEAGGLLTAIAADASVNNHKGEYLLAMDSYRQAVLPADVAYYRAQAADAHAKAGDAADLRDTAALAAGGAVIISMLDAWLRFPSVDAGAGTAPVGPLGAAEGISGRFPCRLGGALVTAGGTMSARRRLPIVLTVLAATLAIAVGCTQKPADPVWSNPFDPDGTSGGDPFHVIRRLPRRRRLSSPGRRSTWTASPPTTSCAPRRRPVRSR